MTDSDKTIDAMSQEEREAAFKNECVAPVISDGILDDEEKNLMDALKIVYRVPDIEMPSAEWMGQIISSNQGRNKSELDAELSEVINKRLHEPGHINLPDKNYIRIEEWQRYREKESEVSIQAIPETSLSDGTEKSSDEEASESVSPAPEASDEEASESVSPAPEASDEEASESVSPAPEASDEEASESVSPVPSSETTIPSGSPSTLATPALTLTAGGQSISFNITTKLSEYSVRQCGEDSQFWDKDWQMTLENRDDGWYVVPNNDATNETILNSKAVTSSAKLSDGDELGVGRESKGIVKLPLKVALS
jgi:hypothetical protein